MNSTFNQNSISHTSSMKKTIQRTAALLLACSVLPAYAQIDRTKQPSADPTPAAVFPAYEQFTLSNGLPVFLVRDPRPIVTFRLLVHGGSSADGDLPGLADAAADLLTQGTATRSAAQFADEIDFLGGSISAGAAAEDITVIARGLKEYVPQLLDLYADAIKHPAYAAEEIDKYRQEQITNLQQAKASPEWLATSAINRVLYGQTAYGAVTTEKSIQRLTTDLVAKYYRTYFVPGNAMLAVVGDFTADELKSKLESTLGDWKKGAIPSLPHPKFPERKGRRIVLVDRPTAVQSAIRVLGKGPLFTDPLRPKTTILNTILGGGSTGRLYMNLRETHGYTYGAYSGFDANSYTGRFLAIADVRNAVTDSALTQMILEIEKIHEGVSDSELRNTVQAAEGGFLMSVADPSVTAQRVLFINEYGLPKDYYQKLVGIYRATSRQDLVDLAKKYLTTDDMAIVVVGKASEIKPKLEKFGKVEVWDAGNL
jgi:predicted Zn-dependent peptidase